jgi:hypothetical protein
MMDNPSSDFLRVSVRERDVNELMERFPKLTRTEISDVITRSGPMRAAVEAELRRLSSVKR